jgi:NitT/TauT family transport system substrate-binding protein
MASALTRPAILIVMALAIAVAFACAPASAPAAAPAKPTAPPATQPPPAAAVAPTSAATQAPAARQKVRYGTLQIFGDAGIFIGMDEGFFTEQGIDVDLTTFDSAANMVAPLATNQLEAGGGAPSAGLYP